ncbi:MULTISPECIES: DUF2024 family protein [Flavobacterium]|uniref:DUF2024 family protein n=1 Tax=Flavobacterium ginsengisoli TaxID=871694 RepID=A0ABP7FVP1_9FLAO|nr:MULTISPECIES: DUF2024 family protein [Flavobacterium]MBJ2125200.1 DUF2024 family protein [Flavobacterium sp. IB48]
MKIAVWDTYVTRKDGKIMHFDILVDENVNDAEQVYEYGKLYLKSVDEEGQTLSSKECRFCHIDKAPIEVENQVRENGFSIIEMENCN